MAECEEPAIMQIVAVMSNRTPAVRNVSTKLEMRCLRCSATMAMVYAKRAIFTIIVPAIRIGDMVALLIWFY